MKKEGLEYKVGIFVFLGMAVLMLMVVRAGDFYLKPGYNLRFVFNFISGIEKGSPVRLAGVPIGEVTSIKIVRTDAGATQAEVSARIQQGTIIEEGSEPRVNALGILGEKYIEVVPGPTGAKPLSDGDVLVGSETVMGERFTEAGTRLIQKIETTFDSVNKVVTDPSFQSAVKGTFDKSEKTFSNAEVFAKNMAEVSEDLRAAAKSARVVLARLESGEGTIGRLLKDESIARDIEAFAKDIKQNPWKLLKKS
jgi:phospholipid/cholesterol/gamma-HCH transport system substrate-binding protein